MEVKVKKYIGLILFLLNTLFVFAETESLDSNLKIKGISKDVFIITHTYPWDSNSLVSIMENGEILIVDTPYNNQAMESVLGWIEKKYGKRKITAINTHFHIDRLGGNEVLKNNNIPIYSSELTVKAIEERGTASLVLLKSWVNDKQIKIYYKNFCYTYPTNIFDSKKGLELTFGNERIEIKYLGSGHTYDNLVVFFPDKKIIFGGCMILSNKATNIGNISDGDLNSWIDSMNKVNTNGYETVIPGHGEEGNVDLIKHTLDLLIKEK